VTGDAGYQGLEASFDDLRDRLRLKPAPAHALKRQSRSGPISRVLSRRRPIGLT